MLFAGPEVDASEKRMGNILVGLSVANHILRCVALFFAYFVKKFFVGKMLRTSGIGAN